MKKLLGSLVVLVLGCLVVLALAGFLSRSVQETYVAHSPVAVVAANDDFDWTDCFATANPEASIQDILNFINGGGGPPPCKEFPGANTGDTEFVAPVPVPDVGGF